MLEDSPPLREAVLARTRGRLGPVHLPAGFFLGTVSAIVVFCWGAFCACLSIAFFHPAFSRAKRAAASGGAHFISCLKSPSLPLVATAYR